MLHSSFAAYREPVVHNLAVLREVAKQVYISEKLAPPTDLQAIRHVYEDGYKKASDASWWRSILESGEWKRLAVYAIEAYGIFTIGEMIGRRWVVVNVIVHCVPLLTGYFFMLGTSLATSWTSEAEPD